MKRTKPTLNDACNLLFYVKESGYDTTYMYEVYSKVEKEYLKNKKFILLILLETIVKLPLLFWYLLKCFYHERIRKNLNIIVSSPLSSIYDFQLNEQQREILENSGFHFDFYLNALNQRTEFKSYEDWRENLMKNYKV